MEIELLEFVVNQSAGDAPGDWLSKLSLAVTIVALTIGIATRSSAVASTYVLAIMQGEPMTNLGSAFWSGCIECDLCHNCDPDGPYEHDIYNFLVLVDTCKMNEKGALDTRSNDPTPADRSDHLDDSGTLHHDTSCECLNASYGHPNDATAHTHRVFLADLYVGTQTMVICGGVSTRTVQYQSEWVTNNENMTRTENYATRAPASAGSAAPGG